MRVLVADDDAMSRKLLQTYLEKWGYEVSVAHNGTEAWRLFEESGFPVVLTDWMMPELDGVELLRRIRAQPGRGYVYTILLTAKTQKEDLVEGMEAGADDFLTKPFDRDELRVRLRAAERIIRLEQNMRDMEAALRQAEQLASVGRRAADVAHELDDPISGVISDLSYIRRDLLTTLRLLDNYLEGNPGAATPQLASNQPPEDINPHYLREHLGQLFEHSLAGLEHVRELVRNLSDSPPATQSNDYRADHSV